MIPLLLKAYWQLIRFDFQVANRDFSRLYQSVHSRAVCKHCRSPHSIDEICKTVDLACIWYRKQVLCLQRSAATACLLKSYGFNAEMVIGAQAMPFRAHAWVEIGGHIVNDKPYTREMYAILDRC